MNGLETKYEKKLQIEKLIEEPKTQQMKNLEMKLLSKWFLAI